MNPPQLAALNSGCTTITRALAATLLFVGAAAGQSAGHVDASRGQSDAENYKFTVRSNLVYLPTRVQTKKGETIYGIQPEQFIVEDNGVRQSVQVDEDPDSWGVSLVVAVQCSRSAPLEFKKLKGLGAMIDGIVGDAPHEVAILAYGERPYVLDDFSGNPDAVPLALSRIKDCGDFHAASIDAVYYATQMLRRRQSHYRRAILLIGETRDHGSRSKLQDVVAELGVMDTVIYSVAYSPARDEVIEELRDEYGSPQAAFSAPVPSPSHPSPPAETNSSPPPVAEPVYTDHPPLLVLPPEVQLMVNALRRNAASELASLSGGEYVNFTTQKGFEASLQRISNQIHDYYVLSFKPTSAPALSLHSLRVRVANHPEAVIQTRRSYWSGTLESSSGDIR
ncbi:MAG: VWA domain-containing protein [Terriglobia bacterium]